MEMFEIKDGIRNYYVLHKFRHSDSILQNELGNSILDMAYTNDTGCYHSQLYFI